MELARIDHRMEWDDAFRDFCKGLEAGVLPDGSASDPKPVVMCGDFNVAHEEIDLKNPGPNRGASGFSDEERGKFTELVDAGFTDTFRLLHPDETGRYSWWSYRFRARSTNAGWRIDYFLVSDELRDKVVAASIYDDVEAPTTAQSPGARPRLGPLLQADPVGAALGLPLLPATMPPGTEGGASTAPTQRVAKERSPSC